MQGWTTVTLRAEDLDPNPTTYYTVNGGPVQTYRGPFNVDIEGRTPVGYWSVDASGNVEPTRTAFVLIDRTPPTVNPDKSGLLALSGPSFSLVSTDTLSGLGRIEARLDSEASRTAVAGPFSTLTWKNLTPGLHRVEWLANDTIFNAVWGSYEFTVLADQKLTASKAGATVTLKRKKGRTALTLTARTVDDAGAAVAGQTIFLERSTDGTRWTGYGAGLTTDAQGGVRKSITFTKTGKTYWRFRAAGTDALRPAATKKTTVVVK
jgi:hypothetical protein